MGTPLVEEGLRFLTLKKEEDKLMRLFNSGLKTLEKKGIIAKLKKKWQL